MWVCHWVCDAWPVRHQTGDVLKTRRCTNLRLRLPTGTLPASEHHRPLSGTILYCLVNRGTCVWTTCPESLREAERPGLEPATFWLQVRCPNHYATTPHVKLVHINYPRRQCRLAWVGCLALFVCLFVCLSVCLCVCPQHNSKSNDPKVFKLVTENNLGIS